MKNLKISLLSIGLFALLFSCGQNNGSEKTENQNDTAVMSFSGNEIIPGKFDTSTLFISVADHFTLQEIEKWSNRKFMALIQDTLTSKYSLIDAIPNKHSFAEENNRIHLFSHYLEVDEDGNVGYLADINLPKNSKCLFLIDNPHMKTPMLNIESKVKWGYFIEPNKNMNWNQGNEKHSIYAKATMENNPSKGINYKEYSLYYMIENNGTKTQHLPINYIPWFDDGFVKILFVGDLDGDQLNDIIIDNSHKYTNEDTQGVLYSTKASGNGTPKAISKQDWGSLRHAVFHTEGC